jgi:hypothetical protein
VIKFIFMMFISFVGSLYNQILHQNKTFSEWSVYLLVSVVLHFSLRTQFCYFLWIWNTSIIPVLLSSAKFIMVLDICMPYLYLYFYFVLIWNWACMNNFRELVCECWPPFHIVWLWIDILFFIMWEDNFLKDIIYWYFFNFLV